MKKQYRIINVGKGILNITKDNLHEVGSAKEDNTTDNTAMSWDISSDVQKTSRTIRGMPIYCILIQASLFNESGNTWNHNLGISRYITVEIWNSRDGMYNGKPLKEDAFTRNNANAGVSNFTSNSLQLISGVGDCEAGEEVYLEFTLLRDTEPA